MIQQSFIVPIIKVTDCCNFNCDFCYYAQRKNNKMMTVEQCKKIIRECFEYNLRQHNTKMRVVFHGGEPLLQPLSFYRELIEFEESLLEKTKNFEFFNSIQTNGYLLTDDYIDFFKDKDFDIGISIDGDVTYNCHFGKTGVEECTKTVLQNINKLNVAKVRYGVISVITNKHALAPEDLYNFCVKNNIHDLSLNYCYNDENDSTVSNELLISFMKKMFDLYASGEYELNIREFNEIIAKCTGYCTDTCAMCDRKNCGQYLSFDSCGNVFFCDTAYDKGSAVGNIEKSSLWEIVDSFPYIRKLVECRGVYQEFCEKCSVQSICGGGCHRYDKRTETGYGNNYFCPTHKEISTYIKKCIDILDQ